MDFTVGDFVQWTDDDTGDAAYGKVIRVEEDTLAVETHDADEGGNLTRNGGAATIAKEDANPYQGLDQPKTTDEKAQDSAPTSEGHGKDDWGYTPDDVPSHWKLKIWTPELLAAAITALQPGGLQGNEADIPAGDRGGVIAKIRAKINALSDDNEADKDLKQHLLERLDALKGSSAKAVLFLEANTTIKSLGGDEFGGYLVVFGDEAHKDLQDDWFTKQTDYGLEHYDKRPALYHHNKDAVIGKSAIGTITSIVPDEIGLWAEGQYNAHLKYKAAIKDMVAKGILAFSSGANPTSVERVGGKAMGEITKWWITEGSFTPMPVQPQGIGEHDTTVVALKHLADLDTVRTACKALDLKTDWLPQGKGETPAKDGRRTRNAESGHNDTFRIVEGTGIMTDFTPEALKALVASAIGEHEAQKQKEAADKAATEKAFNDLVEAKIQERLAAQPKGSTEKGFSVRGGERLPAPAPTGNDITVIQATKYSRFSASEMSFMAQLSRSFKKPLGIEFYRELADKTVKAVNVGQLPYETLDGMRDAGLVVGSTLKANELSNDAQAGSGLEWDADSWRQELWLRIRQDNVIAPNLQMIEMPTGSFELPIESTDPTVYYTGETTDQAMLVYTAANPIGQSKVATAKVQMVARKLALRMGWDSEINEDSIIPILANYQRQAIRAMQNAIDNTLANGDTATGANTNINLIDNTPGTAPTAPSYLAFNGLRKFGLVTNTAQAFNASGQAFGSGTAAPVTLPLLRKLRFTLKGAYALRPRDCMYIVDDLTYAKLLNMPEFITIDKFGPNATVATGQLGMIDGVGVFPTAEMGLSQPTNGEISATGTNNTTGQVIIAFKPLWYVGYRREVTAALEFIPAFDAYHLTVTARLCMVPQDASCAAILYGVSV